MLVIILGCMCAFTIMLMLIMLFFDVVTDFGIYDIIPSKEERLRRDEYLTILEMKINREEALRRGDKYVADPRGICWHYHTIDKDGRIIKKY